MPKIQPKILKQWLGPKPRFEPVSFYREKLLKHQDWTELKYWNHKYFKLSYRRPGEVLHTYKELFEQEIYRFDAGKKDPVILDCGANIGLSVLYFKQLYPSAIIRAYEPDPANLYLLGENIRNNSLRDVQMVPAAIWTSEGQLEFEQSGSQASRLGEPTANSIKVDTVRLRDEIQLYHPDLLKIDIEGAEYEVLKDCKEVIHNIPFVFVEYHGLIEDSAKLTEILSWLDNAGFQYYIKMAHDGLDSPFYRQRTHEIFDQQLNIFAYRPQPISP
jgi:FkbM family methyltransferase